MKKNYFKPTMQVVEIQQHTILCGSPYAYSGKKMDMRTPTDPTDPNDPNQINDEADVW